MARVSQHCAGSDHQNSSQIAIAPFRDRPELLFAASLVSARHEPNPGREVTTRSKNLRIRDGRCVRRHSTAFNRNHRATRPGKACGISKRGNSYLRTLFMQAARVILLRRASWPKHGFGIWLARAAQRLHPNVSAAALANKLARIAWTVLAQERSYEARIHGYPRAFDLIRVSAPKARWAT